MSEWYEYRGYFIRRNVRVAKRAAGGWEGELDVVALHPETKHLVHVETSMDALSWAKRERKFIQKFKRGREHIPSLFTGVSVPKDVEQIVLLGYGGKGGRTMLAGARIILVAELLAEILHGLRSKNMHSEAVPEQFPLLRTLHFVAQHRRALQPILVEAPHSNPTVNTDARKSGARRLP